MNTATSKLQGAGLKLGKVNPSNGAGVVFQQSLAPNRCVPLGTPIDIWVTTPKSAATTEQINEQCAELWMPVPPVVGQTLSDAKKTLAGAGFQVVRVNPPNGTGVAVRQDPKCAQAQTPINIWVENPKSAEATIVQVPDLHGKSLWGAALVLLGRGLRLAGSSKEESNVVAPDRILGQEPAAGTPVPKGSAVAVTLAVPVTVPSPAQSKTPEPPETLTLKSNLNDPAIPGELVTFIAAAEGPAHTIQYQFDFGDGTKSTPSSSPQARHVYRQDGNYNVTVTAILDGRVGQVTASTDVGVHDAPQPVTLDVSPGPVKEKQAVTFTAHAYPTEPAPLLYTFKFGDKSDEVSETPSVTHAYRESNVYYPFVTIVTAHRHRASSNPARLLVVAPTPLPVWVIVLLLAGVAAPAAFVGFVGYKLMQQWVTRGISSKLRLGEVTARVQASHVGLEEVEFQFHTDHSPDVIVVQDRASVVHSVEVRR